MKSTFVKPKKIKRYKTLEALMASFFECKITEVSEYQMGGSGGNRGDKYMMPYETFKKTVENQGIWGYIKDKTMHVWFKPNILVEDLITFIAHEAGHLQGHQYKSGLKDEYKAMVYEDVATYAYINAMKILEGM